eukprot:143285-Prorocentrum_lima.AAC.1
MDQRLLRAVRHLEVVEACFAHQHTLGSWFLRNQPIGRKGSRCFEVRRRPYSSCQTPSTGRILEDGGTSYG